MNNDPSSSTSDTPHHGSLDAPDLQDTVAEEEEAPSLEDGRRLKIRMQQAKRATFLDDLIRNLDIAIYCELSVLYYMEYAPACPPLALCVAKVYCESAAPSSTSSLAPSPNGSTSRPSPPSSPPRRLIAPISPPSSSPTSSTSSYIPSPPLKQPEKPCAATSMGLSSSTS